MTVIPGSQFSSPVLKDEMNFTSGPEWGRNMDSDCNMQFSHFSGKAFDRASKPSPLGIQKKQY
jgi:hypothetical protein